jgi:predicted lipid-binding transport protein (Tim44 family)
MYVDPRGPRFAATLTTVVLAVTLLTGSVWLLAAQAVVFGIGAVRGIQATPYAWLFRRFVRPRLAPPAELEDARPPRFAQGVGLGFAAVGVLAGLTGLTPVFLVATGLALAAAFLNAAFGYCLGCEVYLLIRRFTRTREEIPA